MNNTKTAILSHKVKNNQTKKAIKQQIKYSNMSTKNNLNLKRGPTAGTSYNNNKTLSDWYTLCDNYSNMSYKISQAKFLSSELSGPKFSGNRSEQVSFGKHLKQYSLGELRPNSGKKKRKSNPQFPEIEEKLVQYINLRILCTR